MELLQEALNLNPTSHFPYSCSRQGHSEYKE